MTIGQAQSSGPDAAYAFSEGSGAGAADLSGNGNTATVLGATWLTSGRFTSGLSFDGVDDGVSLPVTESLALTDAFTIEGWIRLAPGSSSTRLIAQLPGSGGDGLRVMGDGRLRFGVTLGGVNADASSPSSLTPDTWIHVGASYDGAIVRLYVDGVQVATKAATGALAGDQSMWIGRARGGDHPFMGAIDEIRIYRRALSASELWLDMHTPVDAATPFQVSGTTPHSGAIGVVSTPITATFTRPVNPSTVTSAAFVLRDAELNTVPATVAYDGSTRTATLTPSSALSLATIYTVGIVGAETGVTDETGNALEADEEWTFTTAAADTVPSAAYAFSEESGDVTFDSSGNGHTAALVNGPEWSSGQFGAGLEFDGVDDGVALPKSDALRLTTAFTLEAWVQPLASGNGQQIVQMPGASGDGLKLTGNGKPRFTGTFPGGVKDVTGPNSLPLSSWTHVAVTYDGSTLRLFVGGTQVATQTATGGVTGSEAMWIGRARVSGSLFYGVLDEIRIYRRALSASAIAADVTTPVDTLAPFQVAAVAPPSGAVGVIGTPIAATFTREIDEDTLTSTTFTLVDQSQAAIAATVSYDPGTRTATLTPGAPLEAQFLYTARVVGGASGVLDAMGNPLSADTQWSFRTAAADSVGSAAYGLEEGSGPVAFDATGNEHTGVLTGNPVWVTGRYGGALAFDGFDDGVALTASDALTFTSALTIEAWVRPLSEAGAVRQIIQLPGAGGDGLRLTEDGRPRFRAMFPSGRTNVTGPTPLVAETWTHVATTYDGSTLRMYVNGSLVATEAVTGDLTGASQMAIGRTRLTGAPFAGSIDEVRIYRRALTAQEIVLNMETPIAWEPPPDPPVSLQVSPEGISIAPGEVRQFFATATYADGTISNVSAAAEWVSSDSAVATVAAGVATGVAAGTTTLTASLGELSATAHLQVQATSPLPPNPATVAPPLNSTVPTTIRESSAFLYTGEDPIQVGVAPETIEARRAAVVRGVVRTRDGQALGGATVTVKGHPEFGNTRSRDDGHFDLAVNGGGTLVIAYEKPGFLPATREVAVPWESVTVVSDVALVPLDTQATTIDVTTTAAMQVARGSSVTDDDGERRATVLFPQGTTASLLMPDGTTRSLRSLTVRATEYTVGPNGPSAMPAALPPTSAYTYAVELSADEALATGARSVRFSAPIPVYVENFLGLSTGTEVPAGFYDQVRDAWVPSDNGRVIKVLAVAGGMAAIDVNGDEQADTGDALTPLQITGEERQQLATLYQPGQSLWRVRVPHFSPWDLNLAAAPQNLPSNAPQPRVIDTGGEAAKSCQTVGSIIECQNQTLGEDVPIAGTPFSLTYRSNRAQGRRSRRSFAVEVTKDVLPSSLQSIEVRARFGGREVAQQFVPRPDHQVEINWDGRDQYGRTTYGTMPTDVLVTYSYVGEYLRSDQPRSFGIPGGTPTGVPSRRPALQYFTYRLDVAGTPPSTATVAGWSLTPHHIYDQVGKVLYLGDGTQVRADAMGQISRNVTPPSGGGLGVIGPDGSRYNMRFQPPAQIERVRPNGQVEVLGPSPFAPFGTILQTRLAVDPRGRLYSLSARQNFGHPPNVTLSGEGMSLPAIMAVPNQSANTPTQLAIANDGTAYVGFGPTIYRVSPGTTEFREMYTAPFPPEGVANIIGLMVGPDSSLYWSESSYTPEWSNMTGRIYRMLPSGLLQAIAGNGQTGFSPDGSVATESSVGPMSLAFDRDGSVVFLELSGNRFAFNLPLQPRVRRIGADGLLSTIAGGVEGDFGQNLGDNGPALGARYRFGPGAGLAVGPDGTIFVTDNIGGLRSISRVSPNTSATTSRIPSASGGEVYEFSVDGRHLRTLHALTGAELLSFGYDSAGRLISVTDGDDLVTTIERDGGGTPTALVAPFGQRTTFTVDAHGHLATITAPGARVTRLTTSEDGLLTEFKDPNGHATTFEYDDQGRLLVDSDAAGGSKTLERSELDKGWLTTVTTELGRATTYRVERGEAGDEKTTVTVPDGTVTVSRQSADGTTETVAADGTQTTAKLSPDPRFGMNVPVQSNVVVRTPAGLTLTTTRTRTATLSDPLNPLSLQTSTDTMVVNGRSYQTVFNAGTRTSTTTTPTGRTSTTTIDAQGRVTRTQLGTLTPVDYTYDAQGRLSAITQGARQSTIAYDGAGRPSTLTDALSRTVSFGYDTADRVTTQTLPDAQQIGFVYDANGNATSVTPPGRPGHTFTFTPVDLTASYTPPAVAGGGPTGYLFNLDRQMTAVQRPDAETTAFGFDTAGRSTTVTFSRGTLQYNYDPAGRVSALVDPGGVGLAFTYDGALPLTETWSGGVTGAVTRTFTSNFEIATEQVTGTAAVSFGYDSDRLLTQAGAMTIDRNATTGFVNSTTLGTTTENFQHNTFGEPTHQTAQVNGSNVFDVGIIRDHLGRITQRIETWPEISRTLHYGYDLAGRLDVVTRDGLSGQVVVAAYTYDANGNRLTSGGEAYGGGAPIAATYDDQDRLLTSGNTSYTYTANGELATKTVVGQTTSYVYDTLGNLTSVVKPNDDVTTYAIDGRGRRVGKSINGVHVKGWLYADQLRPIAEFDGDGTIVSRFVYGARPNVPEYIIRGGVTYRIFSDHLGSPRVIVDTTTGAIMQRMDFHAFGEIIQDSNPGWQPFGFAGGLYDVDTGLVRFGARDYDAVTGRWLAKDPAGFEARQTNLYQYVDGDPVNAIDPTGLMCERFWERAKSNFKITNNVLPGVLAPTGLGLLLGAGKAMANSFSIPTVTLWDWYLSGFRGAVMGAATFTAVETGIVAVGTAAYSAALVALAFETGVLIGSAGEAAFSQCLRSCP